jgi:multidrug efflux pump subunit AcrA (membrane-fusion protein)
MFARVRLPVGGRHKALLVRESAVGTDQGHKYVYVVNDKNVVERRPVELGRQREDFRVVEAGLTADDWVIVKATQGVEPGKTVRPKQVSVPEPREWGKEPR